VSTENAVNYLKEKYILTAVLAFITLTAVWYVLSAACLERIDDVFITMRYSHNFITHGVPTWNVGGELVDGYTSFLYMFILSAMGYIGIDLLNAVTYFNIGAAFVLILLTYVLSRKLIGERDILNLAPPFYLSFFIPIHKWTSKGLEGLLFAVLVTALIIILISHVGEGGKFSKFYGIVFLLTALCRPEGIAVSFVFSFVVLCFEYYKRKEFPKKEMFSIVYFFYIPFLVYFIWHYSYYGYPFPNAYYAKLSSSRMDEIKTGVSYFSKFLFQDTGILLVLFYFLHRKKQLKPLIPVLCFTLFYSCIVIYEGGDCHPNARFFLPIIPIVAVLPFLYYKHIEKIKIKRVFLVLLLLITLAQYSKDKSHIVVPLSGINITVKYPDFYSVYNLAKKARDGVSAIYSGQWPIKEENFNPPAKEAAFWMGKSFPDDTLVALMDVGLLGYYSKLPIHDLYALNSKEGAHLSSETAENNYWGKFDLAFAIEKHPEILMPRFFGMSPRAVDYGEVFKLSDGDLWKIFGHGYTYLRDKLLANNRFMSMYTMRGFEVRAGAYLNLFVRNDMIEKYEKMGILRAGL